MSLNTHITSLLQAHKSVAYFDYSIAVEWAIGQLQQGIETPNMLMLASFGTPIDPIEISPYIAAALKDLGLQEKNGDEAAKAVIQYYANEILLNNSVRNNLRQLHKLSIQYNHMFGLMPFYLLYYAWDELEHEDNNYYYDGATLENIETILQKEAYDWLVNN